MPIVDTVLIKVASRCNINCSYCYVYNMGDTNWSRMPKFMSPSTITATANALLDLCEDQSTGFAVVLHGGEPLLLGPSRLHHCLTTLHNSLGHTCSLNIQTNGILISDPLLDICADFNCSLSVSLDGPAHIHDRSRVGHRNQSTHSRVVKGIQRLRSHPKAQSLFSGLLAVIDPSSDPTTVYDHLKSFDAPTIDFLYRDGNHSLLPAGKCSFSSTEYGSWLCALFDLYLTDPSPPKIRLLDDITKLVLGGRGKKEGVGLTDYGILVIDTDGTITKNDTLKSSFDGADRYSEHWTVFANNLPDVIASPAFAEAHMLQRPTSHHCLNCSELRICGGGMPLHRWSERNRYNNPSIYCNDQRLLLSHIRRKIDIVEITA